MRNVRNYPKLILIFAVSGAFAFATDQKQSDPKLLGEYHLLTPNAKSEIQWAQVKYNNDNDLVVLVDRNEEEYLVSDPLAEGIIYSEDGEPNCDGGEDACYFDVHTTIKMVDVPSGKPRLSIELSVADAFDESGKSEEKTTYTLEWAKEIPDAIPFYTNQKHPTALQNVLDACEAAVRPTVGFGGVSNTSLICTRPTSFAMRDPIDESFKYFLKDWDSKHKSKEISAKEMQKTVFADAESAIKKLNASELKVSQAELINQNREIQNYILLNSNKFYFHPYVRSTIVIAVNTESKHITRYTFPSVQE